MGNSRLGTLAKRLWGCSRAHFSRALRSRALKQGTWVPCLTETWQYLGFATGVQATVFAQQIHLSNRLSKPLIVHTREAEEDTLRLMREHLQPDGFVHVHCFTSSVGLAQQLLESFPNLYIGFTGVITFKNAAAVRDVVSAPLRLCSPCQENSMSMPSSLQGSTELAGVSKRPVRKEKAREIEALTTK